MVMTLIALVTSLVITLISDMYAQSGGVGWFMVGGQYGGFSGTGIEDNRFDVSRGIFLEIGHMERSGGGFALGTSLSEATNVVVEDKADATFYVPFFMEGRYYFTRNNFRIYISPFGFWWSRMHFKGTNGSDNQIFLSAGIGTQLQLGWGIFGGGIRGYRIIANDLQQKWGREGYFSLGVNWKML